MADRTLNTKIKLRYDLLANWTEKNPTLLQGEIAIVAIPTNVTEMQISGTQPPQILFKVGPGLFNDLPYASAKAADVYGWAKEPSKPSYSKAEVGLGNVLNVASYSKDETYAKTETYSQSEVDAKIAEIQGALEADTNTTYRFDLSVANQITIYSKEIGGNEVKVGEFAVDFDALNAEVAKKADKSYVDEELAKKAVKADVEQALGLKANSADVYTKTEVNAELEKKVNVEGYIAFTQAEKEKLSKIEAEANKYDDSALKARVKAIEDDYLVEEDKTELKGMINSKADQSVVDQVSEVANAAVKQSDYDVKVKALEDEDVRIAGLVSAEVERAGLAEAALDERLVEVETFFKTAEGETIQEAMDTLVEIQKYITEDGQAADQMVKDIAANAKAIADEKSRAEGIEAGLASRIKTLEDNPYQLPEDVVQDANYSTRMAAVEAGVAGVDSKISSAVSGEASRVDGLLAEKADQTTVDGLAGTVNGLVETVGDLVEEDFGTRVSALEQIAESLDETYVSKVDDAAHEEAQDQTILSLDGRLAAVESDYLKSTDKTELSGAINTEKGRIDTLVNTTIPGVVSRVETLETTYATKSEVQAEAKSREDADKALSDRIAAYDAIKADILMSTDVIIWDCGGAE